MRTDHRPFTCNTVYDRLSTSCTYDFFYHLSLGLPPKFLQYVASHIPDITHLHGILRADDYGPLPLVLPLFSRDRGSETPEILSWGSSTKGIRFRGDHDLLCHMRLARALILIP